MSSINLQESQLSNCVKYVAIVVDESGSINTTEAQQIRDGLTSFINSQAQSNIVLSLIGMSNSDRAVRQDHVLEKKISGNENDFKTWIDSFGNGRVSVQSDYWASGLNAVQNLTIVPDIIFIVSDGMQVNNTSILKDLYQNLNQDSHIYSYNVTGNFLDETLQNEVINPLTFYLDRTPSARIEPLTTLNSDYVNYSDFSHLSFEIGNILSDLAKAQIGCTTNVEITSSNLIYPAFTKKKPVSKNAGSLVLKNKGKVPLTLTGGTKIHTANNLNGLIFTVENTITIPGLSEAEVSIYIYGAALRDGHFSAPISLNKVKNPEAFSINFNVGRQSEVIDINSSKTNLQSTYLQIAAAGSKGVDSTKGIHLRWMLTGRLGENHLPKGDLFTGESSNTSFNKPDDFVKVYRAPYTKAVHTLNLSDRPNVVDNNKAIWIYKTANAARSIYVNFDVKKYAVIRQLGIDPLTNPVEFMQAYGNNIVEIECKTDLFFAAELDFSASNPSRNVRLETLSVAENKITAAKRITNRKTFNGEQLNNVRLVAENGRSIRFKANNCLLNTVRFEFYSDFITQSNTNGNWILKGKYALSSNDAKVFEQLEPKANSVHGKWLKYNSGQYVNVENYKNKWNKPTPAGDESEKNIKEIVNQYIQLCEVSNPTAEKDFPEGEPIPVNEPKDVETQEYAQNLTKVSFLDLLNIAANDYHIARMLGLGVIDVEDEILSGEYIYLTEYTTFGILEDGIEGTEVKHLSMSIPTSLNTERLSLPVQLNKIVPGLNTGADEDQNTKITDPEGYSFDGKKRFVSLYMDEVTEYDTVVNLSKKIDTDFFKSLEEFDGSSFTFPVYLGVDYKVNNETAWRKPELSHDVENKNVDKNLNLLDFEPVSIVIPETGKPILNVTQELIGENTYIYQGYGINIFSRATAGKQISIKSNIKPANNLMPPGNINSLLVTKENPLLFTSQTEQVRLDNITSADKTLVRILFDYYSAQELISYTLPKEMSADEAKNVNAIFPDNKEILADHFSLYYKDGLPEVEFGQIASIKEGLNGVTSVVRIKEYTTISSGQDVKIKLTETNKNKFIGGILTIGDGNYVIQEINVVLKSNEFDYAEITVVNKEVTDSLHADGDATVDSEQIKAIKIPDSKLCSLVQNMQTYTNWHDPKINFKVQYPEILSEINREVIQPESENTNDFQVEKTRGIWKTALIEKELEDAYERNADGSYKVKDEESQELIKIKVNGEDVKKHFGLYKITFSGFNLPQHPQFKNGSENSVEWANGIIRLFTKNSYKEGNSVPVKSRKEFKVVRTQNVGETGDLILYINDTDFKLADYVSQDMHPDYDEIIIGTKEVNYHPGFRVYLYADQASGITAANIQPRENEDTHYSIFGITTNSKPEINYQSKISIPSPMYAVRIEEPVKPEAISSDSLYATRPDFYNRSTFTFKTEYNDDRKPYGLLHYRANEEDILNVLYKTSTINAIREELKKRGGHDEIHFAERWKNFIDFNKLETEGNYKIFSSQDETLEDYRFPLPDNEELIKLINDFVEWHNTQVRPEFAENRITSITALNQVIISKGIQTPVSAVHFIEQAIHNAFVPLTELPVIYDYIKGIDYVPVNKKQTIKDKNGFALKPTDDDFDIAPMMKIVDAENNITQFTDFNLDGNSQNIYFYASREMDIKMNFGEFSDLLGPVKLVASTPPQTPEIKRVIPILENQVLGIKPAVQIELNAYQSEYKIRKITIYRTDSMQKAQSIRTMKLAKEIVINEETLSSNFENVWTVYDDFEDLDYVPFADGLFYRITVSRQIEYADPASTIENPIVNIDYAPSQPSKITASVIVDTISPESPELNASGTVTGSNGEYLKPVVFNWNKTVYNGKYHLYKMNGQGSWEKLHEIVSNSIDVTLPLLETKLKTDELLIKNNDAERIYHHFKIISENSSGMLSSEEKILTL